MAKKGGGGGVWVVAGIFAAAVILAYAQKGQNEENSPLIPDSLENQMDRVVAELNRIFGRRWVTSGLQFLQSRIEQTMPGVAGLVSMAHWAEQVYRNAPGAVKKDAALRKLRGLPA